MAVHLRSGGHAAATQALAALGMASNIRTQTTQAFSEEEMEGIVGGLP
jgi:uncharacterized protein with GYD domain